MSTINAIENSSIPPSMQGRGALLSAAERLPVAPNGTTGGVAVTSSVAPPKSVSDASSSSAVEAKPSKAQVNQVLEDLIKRQELKPTSLQFSVDEKLHEVVVKVVDPATQKVIRQIPAEAILRMREDLQNMGNKSPTGLLLSEKT